MHAEILLTEICTQTTNRRNTKRLYRFEELLNAVALEQQQQQQPPPPKQAMSIIGDHT